MKLIVALTSTAAALLLGAGIYSVITEKDSPAGIVTESDDNPFAGLDRALADLETDLRSQMTEDEAKAEDDYLSISLSPDSATGAVSDGAADGPKSETENVPYRSCEMDPYVANRRVFMASGEEHMVRRAIYGVVRFQRTLDTGDCTCAGKVAPFELVERIIDDLNKTQGEDWDRDKITTEYRDKYEELRPKVLSFCGGDF